MTEGPGDRERWDAKYRALTGPLDPVDPFVARALDRLGDGRGRAAVDLGAGRGRHALELARRGWEAQAWDVSPVGLAACEREARAAGLRVGTRAVDLLQGEPLQDFAGAFELVLAVNFLDRPLWHGLSSLVAPGGHVLTVTFTMPWPGKKPPLRFRLEVGELAEGLPGLVTEWHEESGGRAGLLARRSLPGS